MKLKLEFNLNPKQVERNLALWWVRITNKLGFDVVMRLQQTNPVDTGFSRGRWVYTAPTTPFGPGKITNDAAYILVLNDGHSKQAAPGWIDACFYEAVRFLR